MSAGAVAEKSSSKRRPRHRRPPPHPPPLPVRVKPEPVDDIKDYAETTMNELLGWYGYDKVVDSRDTQGLNLTHFAASSSDSGREDSGPDARTSSRTASRHRQPVSSGTADEATPSVAGQDGSRGDSSPRADDSANLPPNCILCAWCQKVGMKLFTLKTTTGCKAFCSELCFTQCRRASFKKNKVCDWCKHVRHTVNYVDFQDGEQQLQFCSDKCLNQYKMNIFCRETQAHLKMHPHLQGAACKVASGLITPELWLRDCKTQPTVSSNGHDMSERDDVDMDERITPPLPPPALPRPSQPSPDSGDPVNLSQKVPHKQSHRRRRSLRSSRVEASSTVAQEGGSSSSSHNHQPLAARSPTRTSGTPLSSTSSNLNGQHTPTSPPPLPPPMPSLSLPRPGMTMPGDTGTRPPFLPPHPGFHMLPHMRMHQSSNVPPIRSFLSPPPGVPQMGMPRYPLSLPAPNPLLPPPTVMVPYPIFLPIPIPIPIPIPLPSKTSLPRDQLSPRRPDMEVRERRRRRPTPEHDDMRDSVDTEDEDSSRSRPIKSNRHGLSSMHHKINRTAGPVQDPNNRHLEEDRDVGRNVKRKCSRN